MNFLQGVKSIQVSFRIPLMTWGAIYFLFWCYRSIFSVVGQVVVMRLTPISDTRSYQITDIVSALGLVAESGSGGTLGLQTFATALTKAIGGLFGVFFFKDPIMINIGFQTIGFVGLLAMLRALEPDQRKIFLPILMLPSLTIWSSIASKEALLTFMMGILCAHIINIYQNKDRIRWYHFVCVFLLYAYKPHYLASLFFVFSVTYVAKYFKQKATIAIVALIFSFVLLFLLRKEVSELANWINYALVAMGGDSVRPRLLVEEYDVFLKAPYGMFLSFFGPTLGEVNKIVHVFTFIESSVIFGVFLFFIIRGLPTLPIYNVILSFGTVFWIVFLNYPLGATNAGTAIRYRTGYILLVILAIVFILQRPQYLKWIKGLEERLESLRKSRRKNGLSKT